MISFTQALSLCTSLPRTQRTRALPLFETHNQILSRDICATRALPPFDNSAMDGYAIRLADYGKILPSKGSILAGEDASALCLESHHTYKVMTGSMLPQGTEAVVQIEWSAAQGDNLVQIPAPTCGQPIKQGQNIRFKGEEIAPNTPLLTRGKRLNHLDISILASQGIGELECFAPLRLGIYSSGDEVIEPGEKAHAHQIYNTNATSLYTLLTSRGYACEYNGILRDERAQILSKLEEFARYDVVITSGGASVGDADLLKQVLRECGAEFLFDGLEVKPGRHLALAKLGSTYILLLPGNPLALLLHLHSLILPFLESLQGSHTPYPKPLQLPLQGTLRLNPSITTMIVGRVENGAFIPYNGGKIGSSSLPTMWRNEAIALFCGSEEYADSRRVNVLLYNADYSCDIMDFLNHE